MFCEMDGHFPNHHPDPSEIHNLMPLIDRVRKNKLEIGIAFDGDGDRIGVIDERGEIIWGDRLMILQAEAQGIQAVPLSVAIAEYPGRVDWYRLRRESFDDADGKLKAVLVEAKSDLGLPFGYLDVLKRLLRWLKLFKLGNPVSPKGMFCSEYVARCFRIGGMPLRDTDDVDPWPQELAVSSHVEYVSTVMHDTARLEPRDVDDVHTGLTLQDRPAMPRVRPPA